MKVWAKTKQNGDYHSPNIAQAVYGFKELGAEIIKYTSLDDIYEEISKEDIVLDYIMQCKEVFKKFGVDVELEDYPQVLRKYLGRTIWLDTINSINVNPDKWGIFVKPLKQKAFTGKVIRETKDLIGCGSCYEDYQVYCSEIVNIVREWRAFIYYDELLDIRPYTGDWKYNYNSKVIENALEDFKTWEDRPAACSLDFAVIIDNQGKEKTIFLEANDAYALGCYGLRPLEYAKLISARWSQLLGRPDEFNFK